MNFASNTHGIRNLANWICYGPALLLGKHAELGIEMARHMLTDPKNTKNMFFFNCEFWADYPDDSDAKFQAWLAQ